MTDLFLTLATASPDGLSLPVSIVGGLIVAALGAAGGYTARKTTIANEPLCVETRKDYVPREEFDRKIRELHQLITTNEHKMRELITANERITQGKLDNLIETVGRVDGILEALK